MIDHQLRVLARGIAGHLDGFQMVTDDELGHAAWLQHDDGRRLFLRRQGIHGIQGGRVEIRGAFPDSDYPYGPGERPRPITVAIGRSPAAIAAEISRRLLPGYAQALAQVQARIARQAADQQSRLRVATRLAAILPDATVRDDGRLAVTVHWSAPARSIGSGDIELRKAGALARLEADSLPVATIERLAEVLASLAATTPSLRPPPGRADASEGGR
jgi:hypothetical protein